MYLKCLQNAGYLLGLFTHVTRSHLQALPSIDLIHKSQNAPVPYPTMLHSEQKCAHFCSEWSIVGYGTGAFWDLRKLVYL